MAAMSRLASYSSEPKAIIFASAFEFPCQRHVNERTSFFECEAL